MLSEVQVYTPGNMTSTKFLESIKDKNLLVFYFKYFLRMTVHIQYNLI